MSDQFNYEKTIFENEDKGFQYRLVVSTFREQEYLHLRKYFLSYDGEWVPTKEGAAIPCSLQNVFALLDGLIEVCSKSESLDSIKTHFEHKISELKSSV